MGALRLYLALCVVAAHAGAGLGTAVLDSVAAVQVFYIISGFYMQLILSGKYSRIGQFYESRALRIYAPYFLVLGLVVVVSVASGLLGGKWLALEAYTLGEWGGNEPAAVVLAAVSNVTVFGQDALYFVNGSRGEFLRFQFGDATGLPLWRYALIPPAWTIAVELSFYLVAPFLARARWWVLVGLLVGSLGLRLAAGLALGFQADPWTYRFFPLELALFLAGMLACRLWQRFGKNLAWQPRYPALLALLALALLVIPLAQHWAETSLGRPLSLLALYAFSSLALVGLFSATQSNRLDRFIGELSYPVYLNHFIMVQALAAYGPPPFLPSAYAGIFVMLCSTILAVLMVHWVLNPFERWRHAVVGLSPEVRGL